MNSRIISILICLTIGSLLTESLRAEEGGSGHYVPGSLATLIDLPPTKEGWVVQPLYLHYEGDASVSRAFPIGGLLAAGLQADSDAFTLGGVYTFKPTLLGANYSVAAYVPYVWMSVSATLSTPLGSRIRTESANGLGDMTIVPLMMAWKLDSWQFNSLLTIYAPTGKFDVGSLANTGLNYWSFDPTFGVSYNNQRIGFNAALHTGFAFNTENDDTNYQSGTVWHSEGSVQQLLPLGKGFVGIGANIFYSEQVTGDSGAGARLGSFEGRTFGVGPVLTYVLPLGKNTLVAEIRWLPELYTKNRLNGDYLWVKGAYQF